MKLTILGGSFVLIPLVVLMMLLGKAYDFSLSLSHPLRRYFPLETIGGIAVASILAALLILLFCYLAGLVAQRTLLSQRVRVLDEFIITLFPLYATYKVAFGTMSSSGESGHGLKPVLARFDDYSQIAFEIERNDSVAVVFLPGSPTPFSGTSAIVDLDRITELELNVRHAAQMLQLLGKGTIKLPEVLAVGKGDR